VLQLRNFRRYNSIAAALAGGRRSGPGIGAQLHRLRALVNLWFWAIVGLPTLLAGTYYFGIASNLYLSEVQFVIRAPAKVPTSSISALLSGAPGIPGIEDTFAVSDFIMSRDAVTKLEQEINLRGMFGRADADIVSRFPGVLSGGRNDFEALYKAYARFVSIDIDSQSGIAKLQVKAFRPEDAQTIARELLQYGEGLVNQLNERARNDALSTFQREVSGKEKEIESIQGRLTTYRIQQNMLDPKSAAVGPLELVAKLTAQKAAAQTQLADLTKGSPRSPQIPLVATRIASLTQSIEDARSRITGANDSIASAQAEYERLNVELALYEKALASSFSSLEAARLEAQRQQIYLDTIVQPHLADYPLYPKRVASFAIVVVSCLLIYGVLWLLSASVREHVSA
jgi:capsular polysaccharide transport system permease protein